MTTSFDPLFDISRRAVVVAGAAGGIGSVITRMLAERGAWLTLFDNDAKRLTAFSESLETPHYAIPADMADSVEMESVLAKTVDLYGRVDVVINAAGLLPIAPAMDMPVESFRACMDTNVTGAYILSRAAAQHMMVSGGAMLHIASVSSRVANRDYVAYASSKAALSQMVRVLGREWADRGIRVNAIGPALIETPLTEGYLSDPAFRAAAVAAIPMGRLATAEDLLATVLLLCGPGGGFITGQTLYVDGGRTLTG